MRWLPFTNTLKRWLGGPVTMTLAPTSNGFSIRGGSTVEWSAVQQVRGFKSDNITTDEIWLEFSIQGGAKVMISEEWLGFAQVAKAMESALPSTSDWHAVLSQPPFGRCETVLFPRIKAKPPATENE
jgi:hypothetical protein